MIAQTYWLNNIVTNYNAHNAFLAYIIISIIMCDPALCRGSSGPLLKIFGYKV